MVISSLLQSIPPLPTPSDSKEVEKHPEQNSGLFIFLFSSEGVTH